MIRKKIDTLSEPNFKLFEDNLTLLTCGNLEERNTTTIKSGMIGTIFGKKVVLILLEKSKFTYHLMEKEDLFTLSFMTSKYRDQVDYVATHTGAKVNKYDATGLIPIYNNDHFTSYIMGCKLLFNCKKLYSFDFGNENFKKLNLPLKDIDLSKIEDDYKGYIAEITNILVEEENEE